MKDRSKLFRILDANFNRSREGLRVCEDVTRFVLDAPVLTRDLKHCRHAITAVWKKLFKSYPELLRSRDVGSDVGKGPSRLEEERGDFWELYWANSQRAKEALRALEESVKLLETGHAGTFKKTRFKVYAIEKRTLPKLETLRDHDAGKKPGRKNPPGHSGRR